MSERTPARASHPDDDDHVLAFLAVLFCLIMLAMVVGFVALLICRAGH